MSKATLTLKPPLDVTKPDRRDRIRATWRAAYSQARRMIRDGARHDLGRRHTWFLNHARRRFGASGWRTVQAAGRVAFDLRAIGKAATGTSAELARQGMLTRCVRLEPAPRGLGWCWAWTFDELASAGTNRSLRVHRARQRRAVAATLAADRVALVATLTKEAAL